MTFEDASESFRRTLDACSIRYSVYMPSSNEELKSVEQLFGPFAAAAISRVGDIGNVELPWVVEAFNLYPLDEVPSRQGGYRADRSSPTKGGSDWPHAQVVIGDWAADPVSVATGSNFSIHASRHGRGSWDFVEVSEDVGQFLETLAKWLTWFVIDKGKNILDADFEVGDAAKGEIRAKVLDHLDPVRADRFLRFLVP